MITLERAANQTNLLNADFVGLSTETKPVRYDDTRPIENGSRYYEIDTGTYFYFDQEHLTWI